jgi:threonine synthase
MRRVRSRGGYVLCPHSAVGWKAAEDLLAKPGVDLDDVVVFGTAHPAKFPDAVQQASGIRPALPPRMGDLFERPERVTHVPNDLGALQSLVRERIAS